MEDVYLCLFVLLVVCLLVSCTIVLILGCTKNRREFILVKVRGIIVK